MKQLLLLLLLLPIVYGTADISLADTTLAVEGSNVHITSELQLTAPETIGNLTLVLAQPKNLKVTINNITRTCLVQAEFARCGDITPGSYLIKINYDTTYLVATAGGNTLIRYNDLLPYPAKTQRVRLTLPIGYIIPREEGKDENFFLLPKPTDVYSDGQRIILVWEQQGQELSISVVTRKVTGFPLVWVIIIGGALALAGSILTYRYLKSRPKEQSKELLPKFIEDERKVVELLKKAPNNEAWQKTLLLETKFSKAKMSRIIKNLETRHVVVKTGFGNTNKITLKKEESKTE